MRTGTKKWGYKHPLIDDGRLMSRNDCLSLVKRVGWPPPPRSRCWMCPNQGKHEWDDLEKNWQEDYNKSLEFEKEIQKIDKNIILRDNSGDQGDCMSGLCFI